MLVAGQFFQLVDAKPVQRAQGIAIKNEQFIKFSPGTFECFGLLGTFKFTKVLLCSLIPTLLELGRELWRSLIQVQTIVVYHLA